MDFNIKTRGGVSFQKAAFYPLTDAHMHIQGNDIAPIPIMKGVMYNKILVRKLILGKRINFDELNFGSPMGAYDPNPGCLAGSNRVADSLTATVQLFTYSKGERERLTDLTASVTDYGKVCRHTSYLIAGIYMNDVIQSTMGIQSRSITKDSDTTPQKESEKERKELVALRRSTHNEFDRATMHYYCKNNPGSPAISGKFMFSNCMGMELMFAHYWGAYGIPMYLTIGDKLYFPINENELLLYKGSARFIIHNAYDLPKAEIYKAYNVWENGREVSKGDINKFINLQFVKAFSQKSLGVTEHYCHFLSELAETEVVQFEDHIKHVGYMKVAALKYPFKILPFYHLDARRFFSSTDTATLRKYHEFYIQNGMRLDKVPMESIKISQKDDKQAKFTYQMSIKDLEKELLCNGGLFWGIKMYVALGYPPYIGNQAKANKVFPALNVASYAGLGEFFAYCAKNDIPITCHGSPQGMTIADPAIYLKEYLKQEPTSEYMKKQYARFPVDGKRFCNGLGLIDSFSSPASWKEALKSVTGISKLRLCLAHFGGMGFMNGEIDLKESPYVWMREISGMITNGNGPKIYTDLSCYAFGSCELPVFLDSGQYSQLVNHQLLSSIYTVHEPRTGLYIRDSDYETKIPDEKDAIKQLMALRIDMLEKGFCKDEGKIVKTAKTLADLIGANKTLRHRIMFGTDWPMTETSVMGLPIYNASMFVMLQLLSKYLGNKWDAWHQFAVINPLRFMGLLNEDDDNATQYTIKLDKLKKMKDSLKSYNQNTNEISNDETIRYGTWGLGNTDLLSTIITKSYGELEEQFATKKLKIPSAEKMINESNELLITLETKK